MSPAKRRPFGKRTRARRASRSSILIVCEGTLTEPFYFSALKQAWRLPSVRVVGSEPGTGLVRLRQRARRELAAMSPGDEVWCVVDHDDRESGMAALRSGASAQFHVAVSKPCFEFWLLLHFGFTTRPFKGTPGRSACVQVTRELKRHLPDYQKNDPGVFERVADQLPTAVSNAKRASRAGAASYTDVWKLIDRLEKLRHSASI